MKSYELKRVEEGWCKLCGLVPPEPDRRNCGACAERVNARGRAYYERRKAAGLCATCSKPARPGRVFCRKHAGLRDTRVRADQLARRAAGLCWFCRSEPAPGRTLCPRHLASTAEASRRSRNQPPRT